MLLGVGLVQRLCVFLKVGVPNCSRIFKGWANNGGVSGCFHLSSAILEVSASEAEGLISFSGNILCVSCPGQIV